MKKMILATLTSSLITGCSISNNINGQDLTVNCNAINPTIQVNGISKEGETNKFNVKSGDKAYVVCNADGYHQESITVDTQIAIWTMLDLVPFVQFLVTAPYWMVTDGKYELEEETVYLSPTLIEE